MRGQAWPKVLDCIDRSLSPVSVSACIVWLTTLLPTIKGNPLHEKAVAILAAPIRPALEPEPACRPTVFGATSTEPLSAALRLAICNPAAAAAVRPVRH